MNANRIKVPALEADIQFTVLIGVWLESNAIHPSGKLGYVYEDGFLVPQSLSLLFFFLSPIRHDSVISSEEGPTH